ncbi:diguanylate cyclase [Leucobacter sp. wl10]|uniref:GGDEF domain-containing protein n=1 Tax=Leucobacter sp. wl10 TaxID=2304677 RepID=UPI000E5B3B8D|nr:sensor domain-containing diguanylate cyclase [Leucobacter sp. wl10]RGE23696.1 sensor domain-containing diguanylate cyclase [Leucobacter sp. wl10]
MPRFKRAQTDRSIATALYFFTGALLAGLNVTVFRIGEVPRLDVVVAGVLSAAAGCAVLVRGRRFSTAAAAVLMTLSMLFVVPTVALSPNEIRALNMGLLFVPFFIYVVWFLPMLVARVLGYSWLLSYSVVIVLKHGEPVYPVLATLALTGAVLGELVGHFKKRLDRVSITDSLCDVWNRRGFDRLLPKAVVNAQRTGRPLSLLYVDLDDFKTINDRDGHGEGDRVLQDFARAMQDRTRPQDVFARFGGDEFALLLVDCDTAQALEIGERLRREIDVTPWSFGIAEWHIGEDPETFVSRADVQMLSEKHGRKGLRIRRD